LKQKSSVKVTRRSRVRHITQHSRCGTLRDQWSPGEEAGKQIHAHRVRECENVICQSVSI